MTIDATNVVIALALISSLTTLTTEAIKKLLKEANKEFAPNLLAVIVSTVITIGASAFYIIMKDIVFNLKVGVAVVAMIFLSFLCATVGFDKIKQLVLQLKEQE